MGPQLGKSVMEFLQSQPGTKFTSMEIAKWFFKEFPAECEAKRQKSKALKTDADVIQQLANEIGSHMPGWRVKMVNLRQRCWTGHAILLGGRRLSSAARKDALAL